MRPLRVYADTSVFGGCFDDEFRQTSLEFFSLIRDGRFVLVVSDTLLRELRDAPEHVRETLGELPQDSVERFPHSEEISHLRDAYLTAEILGSASVRDAEHVAAASVAEVDLVVSWNFKHIVHYDKISAFQGINLLRGYPAVRIHTPQEVI